MIEAVLFDWNNTLVHFEWDDELVQAGHRAALGHDDPEFTTRWRELMLDENAHGHRPYAELLAELGVADADAFIDTEHEAWRPGHSVLASAQALLDALRARGVKTGLVANSWPDPGRVIRRDADAFGLAERLDTMVFSEEVGVRKPAPEIFLQACRELEVEPVDTMFVGDSLETDVQAAANLGMTTVQALWFRADDTSGIEPDFMAFTPMDVLNAVRRLAP
ncbi:MAG TPA: HAD family hydrolase [Gaiellaceae bacterium]|jgi:HAD superfamily hydrolase (TIGR01509 family)|nr:HAD family hydrolase [Gaiellaceae bacterium]